MAMKAASWSGATGARMATRPLTGRLPLARRPMGRSSILRPLNATPAQLRDTRGHGPMGWQLDPKTNRPSPSIADELLLLGEMVQATYDSLNTDIGADPTTIGTSRWSKNCILSNSTPLSTVKPASRFEVKSFTYIDPNQLSMFEGMDMQGLVKQLSNPSTTWGKILASLLNCFLDGKGTGGPTSVKAIAGKQGIFMGYVALSKGAAAAAADAKEVVVVWRGTIFKEEWEANLFEDTLAEWTLHSGTTVKVHQGFLDLYRKRALQGTEMVVPFETPEETVERTVRALLKENNVSVITTTGHSLGASLAALNACDLADLIDTAWDGEWKQERAAWKTQDKPVVSCVGWAPPRVGDESFKNRIDSLVKHLRICNLNDLIPLTPGLGIPKISPPFADTGIYLPLDSDAASKQRGSPLQKHKTFGESMSSLPGLFLGFGWNSLWAWSLQFRDLIVKLMGAFGPVLSDAAKFHNLELYLYMVSKFKDGSNRDPRLLNKSEDQLKVGPQSPPVSWWGVKKTAATPVEADIVELVMP